MALDRDPAAIIELRQSAKQFWKIGRAATQVDLDGRAPGDIAYRIASVDVQHVATQQFDRFTGRISGRNQSTWVQIDTGCMLG
jgi:hypothetical protein